MLEETSRPSGSEVSEMLDFALSGLEGDGYIPYYLYRQKYISGGFENIGWTIPGYESTYNICMMEELCSVFALGGGGVTKLVMPKGKISRIFNVKYAEDYINRADSFFEKTQKIETTLCS